MLSKTLVKTFPVTDFRYHQSFAKAVMAAIPSVNPCAFMAPAVVAAAVAEAAPDNKRQAQPAAVVPPVSAR